MKKILFILILPFIFLSTVKADECVNLLPNSNYEFSPSHPLWTLKENGSTYLIPYEEGKTYTFYINDGTKPFSDYLYSLSNSNYIYLANNFSISDFSLTSYTFTYVKSGLGIKQFRFYSTGYNIPDFTSAKPFNDLLETLWIVEGDSVCTPTTEEPSDPIVPSGDSTLNDFYSIYLDKLSLLANYAQENKFLLSFIAIILMFIVLEIISFLFTRGGYRR